MDEMTLIEILKEGLPYAISNEDQLNTALAVLNEISTALTRVVEQRDGLVVDNHRLKVDNAVLNQTVQRLEDNLDLLDGELENASLNHIELLLDMNYWTITDRPEVVELIRKIRSDDQTKLTNAIEDILAYEKSPLNVEELVAALVEDEIDLMSEGAVNTLALLVSAIQERRETLKVRVENEQP